MALIPRKPLFTDAKGNRYLKLPLSSMLPDTANPRITEQETTRETIDAMLKLEGDSIYRLAKDVLEQGGLSPSDLMMVRFVNGKYVVKEGNRRLVALMLLRNPNLAGAESDERRRWKKLAADARVDSLPKYFTVVVAAGDDAWIDRRHMGEQGGVGIIGWNRNAQARRQMQQGKLNLTQALIDALMSVDAERFRDILPDTRGFSTLERLVENPHARTTIGIDVIDTETVRFTKGARSLAMVETILRDMRKPTAKEGRINTRTLNNSDAIAGYVNRVERDAPVELESEPFTASPVQDVPRPLADEPRPERPAPKATGIRALLPKRVDGRPGKIVDQLVKAAKQDMPDAALVLLRVYLELSVEAYARTKQLTFAGDKDPVVQEEVKAFRKSANQAKVQIPHSISRALDRYADHATLTLEERLRLTIENMVAEKLLDQKDGNTIKRHIHEHQVPAQLNDAVHRLSAVPQLQHTLHILEVLRLVLPHLHA
ncbi:MAG TPA: hypothetical protein VGE27_04295 [Gemmatimonas sp.]|uniref:hypothetical protein n=1 Tax=Gemmatimonas sp. TaxID=1962908 RepID=UPI002EDA74F1